MSLEAATGELLKAWVLVRKEFPGDHPANAEHWLKAAYSKLSASPGEGVSAQALRLAYASIR